MKKILSHLLQYHKDQRELVKWKKRGRPSPPPHIVKQQVIRHYAKEFQINTLVETGTFQGDMVNAMKKDFQKIYTIELSNTLYQRASLRFRDDGHIHVIQGDSAIELKKIISSLTGPALFWLDGHYSAGETAKGEKNTPIYEELSHIFTSTISGHVVLIDDARCFGIEKDYPTIAELTAFIHSKRSNLEIQVKDDSIRVTPSTA